MKRLQQSVLLAGVLALSLTACSSISTGWKGLFGSSPMPQAATAPAPANSAATPAGPAVTASAAENGNAGGTEPNAKN